jgi:hypothetical protein
VEICLNEIINSSELSTLRHVSIRDVNPFLISIL